jgi:hypothetical protein
MKDFFEYHFAFPLTLLLVIFLAPTVAFGGLKLATTLFDTAPACEVRE